MQREKYADAESDFDEAARLSFKNSGIYINRALARYHQNNLRGAMSDYDIALDIDKNNLIGHYNRGLLRAQVGDDNRAIEDFDFVLSVEPDNLMAAFNRGLLRSKTGDYKGAIDDYSAVLNEYPNFMPGYQCRAEAYRKIGDLKRADADEIVVLKAQIDAQSGTKNNTASNDKTRKKSDKNMNNYRKIVVADNDDTESKYKTNYRGRVQDKNVNILPQPMFALTYYERKDEVRRQINFDKRIAQMNERHLFPEKLIITNNEMALDEAQVKQHFNSINQLSASIDKEPDNALNYYSRALDFYLVQDFDNALNDLNECIARDSTFFPAYFSRALIHYKELEYRKREKSFEIVVTDEKTAQVRALDYAKIREDFDKVIELAPDFVYAYYNRANILTIMKDYRGAIADYNKVLEIEPNMADAYFNRGLTHVFLGNNRLGIQDLSKAGELGLFSAYNIIKRFTAKED